jgi:hypothetical protein
MFATLKSACRARKPDPERFYDLEHLSDAELQADEIRGWLKANCSPED